jgi:cell division septation protein DedD
MEQQLNDDSSHYEISLTAGQAFVAFVLLLLSLAASFAFGIMVGRGQGPDLVATRQEPVSAITEEPVIVEIPETVPAAPVESTRPETADRGGDDFVIEPARATETPPRPAEPETPAPPSSTAPVPHFAQLLSTGDQKTAELLAARLIDDGFTAAYVERTKGDSGMIHRVRVRFPTEADARAAVPKLQRYTTEEIWVTKAQ